MGEGAQTSEREHEPAREDSNRRAVGMVESGRDGERGRDPESCIRVRGMVGIVLRVVQDLVRGRDHDRHRKRGKDRETQRHC